MISITTCAAHRVAEPLDRRDADGAIKCAHAKGQAVPHVCKAHVALNFTLQCNVQHGLADVHALLDGCQTWSNVGKPHAPPTGARAL